MLFSFYTPSESVIALVITLNKTILILAFDTYYYGNKAKTVCFSFEDWQSKEKIKSFEETLENPAAYQSGSFYKRELPCILSLISRIDLSDVDVIIIDGYVFVDDSGKLGLGGHLYYRLHGIIPVIGVAKTRLVSVNRSCKAVLRGNSRQPLYISAIGIFIDEAANDILSMAGNFRIPTLLKEIDTFSRKVE